MNAEDQRIEVRLKLFATYRRFLPPDSQDGACDLQIPSGTRIADLLARFNIPTDRGGSVVLVNGHTADLERVLEDRDVVAVFRAMAGG